MDPDFLKVKNFLTELAFSITGENADTQVFVVEKEANGIKNMVIACADPILIMEQQLFQVKKDDKEVYKALLKKNRDIIHGAFVLADDGKTIIFRDTLQIENLDKNELEGSLNSLSLLLSEYHNEIVNFSS
jgi:hypothetical protein